MNISKAKCTGKFHRENGIPNQDYVLVSHIAENISIAVLADGAGSKKYGGQTAGYIMKYVEQYCRDYADCEDFLDVVKDGLFSYVNDKLIGKVQEEGAAIDAYGATMLFAIVCDYKYVAGHMGDGVILCKNASPFQVLSLPDNGEYINQTYFIPTITDKDRFRIYEGELGEEFCFILTSDGMSGTLYNQLDNQVSPVCEKMYQWCKK
ncbi:MAG: protein phosphatase 2C domain-containing protein, partial [Lachnospiraceae bacterium]|nr:protein phosphatase 2C domain-containing protein [Lachnospiraceae bacterium]